MAETGGESEAVESVEDVQARHRKELKALEGNGRRLIKQANKNKAKIAEAEAKVAKMLQETKKRHQEELEAAEAASKGGDGRGGSCEGGGREAGGTDEATKGLGAMSLEDKEKEEREKRDQKRAKAQRKRNKQREKEAEREARIEREKREGGPDPRIIEMDALGAQVAPRGFRVSEIKADGHCLYRAVAEQLHLTGRRPGLSEESFALMRKEAARHLRAYPGDYLPFLDDVDAGEAFEIYCSRVEESAEWGGQVELQALSCALEVPVEVFSATSPPLLLGEKFGGAPLMLTYHEHYYALGAHYNSVVPL